MTEPTASSSDLTEPIPSSNDRIARQLADTLPVVHALADRGLRICYVMVSAHGVNISIDGWKGRPVETLHELYGIPDVVGPPYDVLRWHPIAGVDDLTIEVVGNLAPYIAEPPRRPAPAFRLPEAVES